MLLVDDLAAGGTKNLRHTPRGLVTLHLLFFIYFFFFQKCLSGIPIITVPNYLDPNLRLILGHKLFQGSYRQDCVKFKDFSKTFLLLSRTENLRKILIYMLEFYFGNARVHY